MDDPGPAPSERDEPKTTPPHASVLETMSWVAGVRPRVHLRDEGSQASSPMVKPLKAGDEAVPERAGKYRVQGEVARGGVGVIFKGHDVDLGREVALKFLHARYKKDPALLQRFIEEAQIGGQLQHPGIVPVYDLGLSDDRPFFTMKFVKGRTLAALLGDRADPSAERSRFLSIFERVCQTMVYAHARGVVHRDLKPANVMLGAFGEVQIVDWGMGKVLSQGGLADEERIKKRRQTEISIIETVRSEGQGTQSIVGSAMGTPAYMPPEQATGDVEHMDERSDVFSLGAILCEILTGKPPYVGDSREVLLMAARYHLDPAHARLAACGADDELVAITKACLAPSPAARPANAKELAEQIGAFLAAGEHKVRDAEVRAAAARRTQKWALAVGAIVVVALVVSLGFWRRAESERRRAEGAAQEAGIARGLADREAEQARLAQQQEQAARADADAKAAALRKALDEFDLLADVVKLREASTDEARLYPAWPEQTTALEQWIEGQARPLAASLPRIEDTLKALRSERGATENGEHYVFPAKADQFLHDTLTRLVADLRTFGDPDQGPLAAAEERLAWARTVQRDSVDRYEREWREAIADIAQLPAYDGLKLEPQTGLVPLRADPKSGLWEFAHLRSGTPGKAIPQRDPTTGWFEITEDAGMVFVLVPGGEVTLGAQAADPTAPHHDPQAEAKEGPPHTVRLAPYFLSKHELTQAQWRRLSRGEQPSGYKAGTQPGNIATITWSHPVENVSWGDAVELLRRHGLTLPTEAQWERACRGGTTTPWSTGAEVASLQGHANVADQAAQRGGVPWQIDEAIDDGHVLHAPVGSLAPNPFGLFDMHGNVWEWCRDANADYTVTPREGDGLRSSPDQSARINRGGSFAFPATRARSAYRFFDSPETRDFNLGVRAARSVLGG